MEKDADGKTLIKENANQLLDSLLQTISRTEANKVDGKISETLRNVLFGAFGEDLASRNIFRGRDVGLASYKLLTKCYGSGYRPQVCFPSWTPHHCYSKNDLKENVAHDPLVFTAEEI